MSTFIKIAIVALVLGAALFWSGATPDAEAGIQLWCADFSQGTYEPGHKLYPYQCFWNRTDSCELFQRPDGSLYYTCDPD